MALSTDMLCIKENIYTEQKELAGQKTVKNVFRYFREGKRQMIVIYREEYIGDIVELIAQTDCTEPIKIYVYSPSDEPWSGEFEEVEDKVTLCALPAAILNTYRRVLPKKKDQVIDQSEEEAL